MDATDDFTSYYAELLEGRYDCMDRLAAQGITLAPY